MKTGPFSGVYGLVDGHLLFSFLVAGVAGGLRFKAQSFPSRDVRLEPRTACGGDLLWSCRGDTWPHWVAGPTSAAQEQIGQDLARRIETLEARAMGGRRKGLVGGRFFFGDVRAFFELN